MGMSLTEELTRLQQLHAEGALNAEEFARAKAKLIDSAGAGGSNGAPTPVASVAKLRRSIPDRWVGGVCGGIALATGTESWIWRLVVSALTLAYGTGLVIYLLLWIFVPEDN
jgi:phage shock protein C